MSIRNLKRPQYQSPLSQAPPEVGEEHDQSAEVGHEVGGGVDPEVVTGVVTDGVAVEVVLTTEDIEVEVEREKASTGIEIEVLKGTTPDTTTTTTTSTRPSRGEWRTGEGDTEIIVIL